MNFTKHIASILVIFFLLACDTISVKKDIVRFDQAYIPVFSYVYQGNMVSAQRAAYFLDNQWQKIYSNYKNQFAGNENALEHLRRMDCWLADAYDAIAENNQMYALNQLDHARYELMELSRKNNIEYYLDDVWTFEAMLDVMVETTSDKMLCLLEWKEFLDLVEDFEKDWETVRQAELNDQLFEFDPLQMVHLKSHEIEVTNAMINFREAVECANADVFAPKAQEIVKPFMSYLNMFGNFEASNVYIANAKN